MKKLSKLLFISALSGIFFSATAQERTLKLSLEKACQLAVDSNLQIINARIEIQKNHFQELEAKSKLYPTVEGYSDFNYYYAIPRMMMPGEFFGQEGEISVEIGTKFDWSNGFKASVSLVDLSKLTAIKLAKSMKEMGSLSLEQKKEEILYQVHQLYYMSQSTSKQIEYLNKNLSNTNKLLEILDAQIRNGVARKIDYSKVSVTKNNLLTQIDNLQKLKDQQNNMLKYILGLNRNEQVQLTDSLNGQPEISELVQPDFANHNDIKLIENELETTQLNKQSVTREYVPRLAASSQFYYQGQQNKFNFLDGNDRFFHVGFVGLSLNVPIFDGFEKHNKIRQYNSEIEQLQNTRQNALNSLGKDYENALTEYSNSLKAIRRQQENMKVAEYNYNISLDQYKQQMLLLSELILAENSLTEARVSYVDAVLQLNNAALELKKINGKLRNN
jgi:outer membrane protein TolC